MASKEQDVKVELDNATGKPQTLKPAISIEDLAQDVMHEAFCFSSNIQLEYGPIITKVLDAACRKFIKEIFYEIKREFPELSYELAIQLIKACCLKGTATGTCDWLTARLIAVSILKYINTTQDPNDIPVFVGLYNQSVDRQSYLFTPFVHTYAQFNIDRSKVSPENTSKSDAVQSLRIPCVLMFGYQDFMVTGK